MTTRVPKKLINDPAACNAWVRVRFVAGVPTILASHNVSSLSDNGTGDFSVNFTQPFASATGYIAVVGGGGASVAYTMYPFSYNNGGTITQQSPMSASSCRVGILNFAGSFADPNNVDLSLAFYGDLA